MPPRGQSRAATTGFSNLRRNRFGRRYTNAHRLAFQSYNRRPHYDLRPCRPTRPLSPHAFLIQTDPASYAGGYHSCVALSEKSKKNHTRQNRLVWLGSIADSGVAISWEPRRGDTTHVTTKGRGRRRDRIDECGGASKASNEHRRLGHRRRRTIGAGIGGGSACWSCGRRPIGSR